MQVINYVLEKLVINKPLDEGGSEGASSSGQTGHQGNGHGNTPFRPGLRVWQQPVKPVVEILCNQQVDVLFCQHDVGWMFDCIFVSSRVANWYGLSFGVCSWRFFCSGVVSYCALCAGLASRHESGNC